MMPRIRVLKTPDGYWAVYIAVPDYADRLCHTMLARFEDYETAAWYCRKLLPPPSRRAAAAAIRISYHIPTMREVLDARPR